MLLKVYIVCLFLFAISFSVDAAPQFGAFSQSNAQAGAIGGGAGGFSPPSPYGGAGGGFGPRPGFGPNGYGPPNRQGPYGRGFQNNRSGGLSISVSKSVSIGRGGAAQSSSSSLASGK